VNSACRGSSKRTVFFFNLAVALLVNTCLVEGQIGKILDRPTRNFIFFIIRYKLAKVPVRCTGRNILKRYSKPSMLTLLPFLTIEDRAHSCY
jgi:hypothetical protein